MTLEEAGDIILRGTVKYITCTACLDTRYSRDPAAASQALGCQTCGGFGQIVNPTYAQACLVVGIDPPKPFTEFVTDVLTDMKDKGIEVDAKSMALAKDLINYARGRQGA